MKAAHYTHGHHASVLTSHVWRTAANSAGYLLEHLTPGMSLLDIGCGPGTITLDFAARLAPGKVVGIDAAPGIVAAAAQAAEAAGSPAIFEVGDVYAFQDYDERFDIVHAHQVLQHLSDPVGALEAMRARARPGGIVAVRDADYGAMFWYPQVPELDDWRRLYREVARRNGGEPDAARLLPAWTRAAGFTDVTIVPDMWCFATPDDRAWWGGMWATRIVESAFADDAVAAGLATPDDLARLSDGWRRWADDPEAFFGVPHTAIVARP